MTLDDAIIQVMEDGNELKFRPMPNDLLVTVCYDGYNKISDSTAISNVEVNNSNVPYLVIAYAIEKNNEQVQAEKENFRPKAVLPGDQ